MVNAALQNFIMEKGNTDDMGYTDLHRFFLIK